MTALISEKRDPTFVHKYVDSVVKRVASAEDICDLMDIIQIMVDDIVNLQKSDPNSERPSTQVEILEWQADRRLLASRLAMNKRLLEEYRKMEKEVMKDIEAKLQLLKEYQINRNVLALYLETRG